MSEEVKLEDIAEQPEEAVTEFAEAAIEEAPAEEESSNSELSEAEAKAREQGWKPPEEFEEDGKEPISAEEFLRRGELFDKIKDLKNQSRRETQRLQQQVEELTGLVRTERKRGYEQAFKDLEGRRREAIETGDLEAFNQIDEEYIRVRDELTQESMAEKQNAAEIPEEAVKFQEANADWFNSNTPENSAMVNQAVTIDQYLAEAKPYLTPAQRLQSVEKEIKNLYPHRFSNPKKKAPAKVEANASAGTVPTGAAKGKIKYSDLDDKQKAACERFMSLDPSLTAEDYLKSVEEGLRLRNQL